jgi:putative methyltransferase (TIGR04325 family)
VTRRIVGLVPSRPSFIWTGVYENFEEVPVVGNGHANADYIQRTLEHTRSVITTLENHDRNTSPFIPAEYTPFNVLASVIANEQGALSVLDVGGGLGISYAYLKAGLSDRVSLRYQVCEVKELCAEGRKLFKGNREVSFSETIPTAENEIDIVQFCSSLQYIDDFRSVIATVCVLRPKYIYVLKIPVGSAETFATGQYNLPGSVTPVWFINFAELVQEFSRHGYKLIVSGTHDREYDMSNFDPAFRVGRYSHLLFAPASRLE